MRQPLAAVPVVVLEQSDQPLAELELAAQASWELPEQPVTQPGLVVMAETAKAAAALVQQVSLPVAVAAVGLLVVAPVAADQQVPRAALAMTKELAVVAPVVLHLPEV
jgi:hypothetical protein